MSKRCNKNKKWKGCEKMGRGKVHEPYNKFKGFLREKELTYSDVGKTLNISADTLLSAIDSSLKWKPNERNTLCKIINEISPANRPIFTHKLPKIIKNISGDSISAPDQLWGWIYDLRCNIVHLKVHHSKISISEKNWNEIFQGLIEIIISAYDKYDNH